MKSASASDIVEKQETYRKKLDELHKSLLKLTWYMRGGVSISEIHEMPAGHISHLNEIINENFEMSKKAGTPIL